MSGFTESTIESATLAWLEALGYAVLHGRDIAAGEPGAERSDSCVHDSFDACSYFSVLDNNYRNNGTSVNGRIGSQN